MNLFSFSRFLSRFALRYDQEPRPYGVKIQRCGGCIVESSAYPVTDIARSNVFYENVLGLKVGYNFKDKWVEYNVADSAFAITTTEMGRRPGAKGAVMAFEVTNLDGSVKTLKDKSVTFLAQPFSTPACQMAVIQDPDGNEITIHQRH